MVVPSKKYSNVTYFIEKYKPPFFEDYTIEIVDDECFNNSSLLLFNFTFFVLFINFLF
jgi:hypothetical protein